MRTLPQQLDRCHRARRTEQPNAAAIGSTWPATVGSPTTNSLLALALQPPASVMNQPPGFATGTIDRLLILPPVTIGVTCQTATVIADRSPT